MLGVIERGQEPHHGVVDGLGRVWEILVQCHVKRPGAKLLADDHLERKLAVDFIAELVDGAAVDTLGGVGARSPTDMGDLAGALNAEVKQVSAELSGSGMLRRVVNLEAHLSQGVGGAVYACPVGVNALVTA